MTKHDHAITTGEAFRQFQYPTVPLHLSSDTLAAEFAAARAVTER